jgi:hypothetical protein
LSPWDVRPTAVKEAPAAGWRTLEILELFPFAEIANGTRRGEALQRRWRIVLFL